MRDIERQLRGHQLTTVEILYHMPDHPSLLQTYVWQTLDLAPSYPRLSRFFEYWERHIEARLHSVKLYRAGIMKPRDVRFCNGAFVLH